MLTGTDDRVNAIVPAGASNAGRKISAMMRYAYDKKKRIESERELEFCVRNPDSPMLSALRCYQYDSRGRLSRIFILDEDQPEYADSVLLLPQDFAFRLLRSDGMWEDTVNRWLYGNAADLGGFVTAAREVYTVSYDKRGGISGLRLQKENLDESPSGKAEAYELAFRTGYF